MLALAIVHRSHSEATKRIARQFEDLTVAAGFHFRKVEIPREGLQFLRMQPALANHRTLILWCTKRADIDIPGTIAAFVEYQKHSEVIVYAHEDHWSGKLAVSCIENGACDFLVDGIHHELFEEQVEKLVTGGRHEDPRNIYGRYRLNRIPRVSTQKRVFVATPYLPASHHDRRNGIYPALNALGMQAFESIDEYRTAHIWQKIKNQIDESALVIANVSLYGGGHNANVALEIGYAMGRSFNPIIIQHAEDKNNIYADLGGVETLRYYHCSDLAVRLFVGLRNGIT